MSVKFDVEFDLDASELLEGFDSSLKAASATVAGVTAQRAKELAGQRLKSGLKWWEQGFSVDKVEEGVWVLSMTGKLSEMMEGGFTPQQFKDLMLSGNRARHNRAQGKNYVDIPMPKQVDSKTQSIQGTSIKVQKFTDIHEFQKQQYSFSDYKKGGVKKRNRLVKRVDDIIQTKKSEKADSTFMTIRRLTPTSSWPSHPFAGAQVFDALDHDIEVAFTQALQKLL